MSGKEKEKREGESIPKDATQIPGFCYWPIIRILLWRKFRYVNDFSYR